MQSIDLKADEIHFFYTMVGEIKEPALLSSYRAVLNTREKEKTDRYIFEKDRHNCLVTRALLRSVLSAATDLAPERFDFIENNYGKPFLKPGITALPLAFNLSHTKGITACALTLDRKIGIDIEHPNRKIELDLADRYFTTGESAHIRTCPADRRQSLFFDYWTLKEAYIKAVGKGLSIELNSFGFELHPGISIHFKTPSVDTDTRSDQWRFFKFSPAAEYTAAIAIPAPQQADLKVYIHQCIPFVKISLQEVL